LQRSTSRPCACTPVGEEQSPPVSRRRQGAEGVAAAESGGHTLLARTTVRPLPCVQLTGTPRKYTDALSWPPVQSGKAGEQVGRGRSGGQSNHWGEGCTQGEGSRAHTQQQGAQAQASVHGPASSHSTRALTGHRGRVPRHPCVHGNSHGMAACRGLGVQLNLLRFCVEGRSSSSSGRLQAHTRAC